MQKTKGAARKRNKKQTNEREKRAQQRQQPTQLCVGLCVLECAYIGCTDTRVRTYTHAHAHPYWSAYQADEMLALREERVEMGFLQKNKKPTEEKNRWLQDLPWVKRRDFVL